MHSGIVSKSSKKIVEDAGKWKSLLAEMEYKIKLSTWRRDYLS